MLKYGYTICYPGLAERLRQRTHNSPKAGSTPAPWIKNKLTVYFNPEVVLLSLA